MIFVIIGVSGSGKSTIGTLLASRLGLRFADADDYHSQRSKANIAAGNALTDDDRRPWLEDLNRLSISWVKSGEGGVLACSTLKHAYRSMLTSHLDPDLVFFVWLDGPKELIETRLATRLHEFTNASLLESQIAEFEPPLNALRVINDKSAVEVVDDILRGFSK